MFDVSDYVSLDFLGIFTRRLDDIIFAIFNRLDIRACAAVEEYVDEGFGITSFFIDDVICIDCFLIRFFDDLRFTYAGIDLLSGRRGIDVIFLFSSALRDIIAIDEIDALRHIFGRF